VAAATELKGRELTQAEMRFVQRFFERAKQGEAHANLLVDGRRRRMTQPTVMVPLVKALVLLFWNGRRKITAPQIAELVRDELKRWEERLRQRGIATPLPTVSSETIQKFLNRLPPALRDIREKGLTEYARQHRVVCATLEALFANHLWEIDNSPLDLAAILDGETEEEVDRLWITALIDAYSGLPLAVHVDSRTLTAYTTSIVLRDALTPREIGGVQVGGLPELLVCDRGSDFTSCHVETVAAALGIELRVAAPRSGDEKPHIERFFGTLNRALAEFPGYKPADGKSAGARHKHAGRLLTVRRIKEEVERIRVAYCQTVSEKRDGAPITRWAQSVQWRPIPDGDVLHLLLLKSDAQRTLTREGVRFGRHTYFNDLHTHHGQSWTELQGRKVIIRYHPDISDFIIVYDAETNALIGEMIREDLYTHLSRTSSINQRERLRLLPVTRAYENKLKKMDSQRAKEERQRERDQQLFGARELLPQLASGAESPTEASSVALAAAPQRPVGTAVTVTDFLSGLI
jgi:transposase InsO family protein